MTGAATATLAALYYRRQGHEVRLVTFGSPRVGDSVFFKDAFTSSGIESHHRYVTVEESTKKYDIAAAVPPIFSHLFLWSHVPSEEYIALNKDELKQQKLFGLFWTPSFSLHSSKNYVAGAAWNLHKAALSCVADPPPAATTQPNVPIATTARLAPVKTTARASAPTVMPTGNAKRFQLRAASFSPSYRDIRLDCPVNSGEVACKNAKKNVGTKFSAKIVGNAKKIRVGTVIYLRAAVNLKKCLSIDSYPRNGE